VIHHLCLGAISVALGLSPHAPLSSPLHATCTDGDFHVGLSSGTMLTHIECWIVELYAMFQSQAVHDIGHTVFIFKSTFHRLIKPYTDADSSPHAQLSMDVQSTVAY